MDRAGGISLGLCRQPREDPSMGDLAAGLRVGGPGDAAVLGRMLHEFNAEYGEREPSAERIAELAGPQLARGEVAVVFAPGDPPAGFAQLRYRGSLYDDRPDACLEELWVRPEARGRGLGRALLEAALDLARAHGAGRIDLNTAVTDVAARALYASCGFTNEELGPGGPSMLYYERDL
jgi:ribosomal protein S18 acetylase RimI-like enzyme